MRITISRSAWSTLRDLVNKQNLVFFLPLSELLPNGPRRFFLAYRQGSSTAYYPIPGLSFPIFHHLKVLDLERMPLEDLTGWRKSEATESHSPVLMSKSCAPPQQTTEIGRGLGALHTCLRKYQGTPRSCCPYLALPHHRSGFFSPTSLRPQPPLLASE